MVLFAYTWMNEGETGPNQYKKKKYVSGACTKTRCFLVPWKFSNKLSQSCRIFSYNIPGENNFLNNKYTKSTFYKHTPHTLQ